MTSTRLPKTITAGALLATPIPPVKWIIPGLLPAGLAIFAGPSKAGKSWLTLWLCLQISQGKSVWGREIEPRTVLYFSLEDTLGRLQERLYQLVDAEEDPERLILQTESHGIGQGLEEQIVSFIHTYPDISLIVIDTLQKVRKSDQNGSMYANDYKDIGAWLNGAGCLSRNTYTSGRWDMSRAGIRPRRHLMCWIGRLSPAYPAAFLRNLSAAGRHQQTGGGIPAGSCGYGIFGAHLLPPAGSGEASGGKPDARSAEQPKSVLCCIYEK